MNKKLMSFFYIFTPIILGSLVGFIISSSIDYQYLNLPPLAPPKIAFPIAWSIIYLLMGISYYFFKKKTDTTDDGITFIYYLQLFVNLLWSFIFFLLKWRLLAVIWILLLDGLVINLIKKFWNKEKVSAYLNLPYLIWIIFATYLTTFIYILN